MSALVRYDAACLALAEAKSFDEVRDVHDKAEALRLYGRQAKNKELEIDAAEIRLRAERRLGEMLTDSERASGGEHGGKQKIDGTRAAPSNRAATLAEIGIDKKLSARAQKIAAVPASEFEGMIGSWRDRVGKENERVTTDLLRAGDKADRRAERERDLGSRQGALPDASYGVILADPEWRFEPYSRDTGMDRAADNHYPTSDTEIIASRPVASIAADDCALFLWATVPMLPQALGVLAAWGFDYRSHFIWRKDRIGTGYWNRNKHEILLIGIRGKIPAPAMGTQWDSIVDAPVGGHSVKPDAFYELIEAYFPTLPKIELNARRSRAGWAAWGNEAP